jgi:hypothetical protein
MYKNAAYALATIFGIVLFFGIIASAYKGWGNVVSEVIFYCVIAPFFLVSMVFSIWSCFNCDSGSGGGGYENPPGIV